MLGYPKPRWTVVYNSGEFEDKKLQDNPPLFMSMPVSRFKLFSEEIEANKFYERCRENGTAGCLRPYYGGLNGKEYDAEHLHDYYQSLRAEELI